MEVLAFLLFLLLFPPIRLFLHFRKGRDRFDGISTPGRHTLGIILHIVNFVGTSIFLIVIFSSMKTGSANGVVLLLPVPFQIVLILISEILMRRGKQVA